MGKEELITRKVTAGFVNRLKGVSIFCTQAAVPCPFLIEDHRPLNLGVNLAPKLTCKKKVCFSESC